MFSRADLKYEAKARLSNYYWKAVVVCLLVGMVAGGSSSNSSYSVVKELQKNGIDISPLQVAIILWAMALSILVAVLIGIFAGYPLQVGKSYFFLQSREVPTDILAVAYPFAKGRYTNIVKTMFMKDLFITLWSLLFIIPGIIKAYDYYLVPYILAENPNIDYKDALSQSKNMMYGNKLDTFILNLSFIGWNLLGVLLCCIGTIFVAPYIEATYTELYLALKEKPADSAFNNSYENY